MADARTLHTVARVIYKKVFVVFICLPIGRQASSAFGGLTIAGRFYELISWFRK